MARARNSPEAPVHAVKRACSWTAQGRRKPSAQQFDWQRSAPYERWWCLADGAAHALRAKERAHATKERFATVNLLRSAIGSAARAMWLQL